MLLEPPTGPTEPEVGSICGIDPEWASRWGWVNWGAQPGPTLAVTAGMHAAEYVPIEAVTRSAGGSTPKHCGGR